MPPRLTKVPRTIVLVGLMGAGKSCIGRRLAAQLALDFVDADAEIERAAGCSIEEIFERHGETAFRDGERRVIARLLNQPIHVLATGGGSFMDPRTRSEIRGRAITVWLRADLELLLKRTGRRSNRPLLKRGNPREILEKLIAERYSVYGQADVIVDSSDPDTFRIDWDKYNPIGRLYADKYIHTHDRFSMKIPAYQDVVNEERQGD
ncbi:MAG: shikimate kinase [Proteobacteria bacterium]|nr:shikimate kinase [Pseudomonadota bacterium]